MKLERYVDKESRHESNRGGLFCKCQINESNKLSASESLAFW